MRAISPMVSGAAENGSTGVSKEIVAICVPCNFDWMRREFVASLFALKATGHEIRLILSEAHELFQMRNLAVKSARVIGATWLLLVDADMTFPPDALDRLLSRGVPIVGALCRERRPPFSLVGWMFPDEGADQTKYRQLLSTDRQEGQWGIHVAGAGCGFLLIKMEVFDQIDHSIDARTADTEYFRWGEDGLSEDLYFCKLAYQAGFDIYIDCETCVGHLATVEITDDHGAPSLRILKGV